MKSTYITSAQKKEQLPAPEYPEVAIIGRSNCGKSSLINVLLQRKGLARSGKMPGVTQMVNFFLVNDSLMIADLPGYGFSKNPKIDRQNWADLIQGYFKRKNIIAYLFLMDIRRDLDQDDELILTSHCRKTKTVMILTKSDKLSKPQIESRLREIEKSLKAGGLEIAKLFIVSSLKKTGITEINEFLSIGV